jgi:hypothetical protein
VPRKWNYERRRAGRSKKDKVSVSVDDRDEQRHNEGLTDNVPSRNTMIYMFNGSKYV